MKFDDLFDADGIFLTTEQYILRRIRPAEKESYEKLAQAETPAFLQASADALAWEELLSEDHLTCSILERDTGAFCGFCQLQLVFSATPELGIDLLSEYQKKGVAAEVLPSFLKQAKSLLKKDHFYSKIKKNNIPSQKLAEKIGGICIGTKSLLPEDFPAEMTAFAEKEFPDFFYLEYHFMK
ncbi:MAG: GNAT family N-acetyltransferase [Anaerotignum sp.]|nr:GNAT family N-acetyltransferase [Anaerotignum sp.]